MRSTRFPVVLVAEYSRAAMVADYDDVLMVARLFPTVISFFLILFAWLSVCALFVWLESRKRAGSGKV